MASRRAAITPQILLGSGLHLTLSDKKVDTRAYALAVNLPRPFRLARAADVPALLDLVAAFYAGEGYPFDRPAARAAMTELLDDPGRGWVWVVERGVRPIGYVVVALAYSLEYRGRTAFVDEIYLVPAERGRGLGSKALALVERAAAGAGARAIHLEVERSNRAHALYRRRGFDDRGRLLLTKLLPARGGASGTTRRGPGGRKSPSRSRGGPGRRA